MVPGERNSFTQRAQKLSSIALVVAIVDLDDLVSVEDGSSSSGSSSAGGVAAAAVGEVGLGAGVVVGAGGGAVAAAAAAEAVAVVAESQEIRRCNAQTGA